MNCRWIKGVTGLVAVLCVGLVGVCNAADTAPVKPVEKPAVAAKAVPTLDNLKTAYLTESALEAQYLAFASKATQEGYKSVSVLFRAAAMSQRVLVKKNAVMIRKMAGTVPDYKAAAAPVVKTTRENLIAALAGNIGDKNTQDAEFAKQAEADKDTAAMYSFKGAISSGIEYVKYFNQALADLDGWRASGKIFSVCEVCSYLVMGPPPAVCPVCSAPKDKFVVIK